MDADYRVRLHPHSFCAQNACSFTSAYRSGVVRAGWLAQEVGCPGIEAALIRMYRSRIAMSRAYDTFLLGGERGTITTLCNSTKITRSCLLERLGECGAHAPQEHARLPFFTLAGGLIIQG